MTDTTDKETNERTDGRTDEETRLFVRPSVSLDGVWHLRIQFKIAVLTYTVLHGDAPRYLGPFTSTADVPGRRALRSAGSKRLVVPSLDFLPSVAELFRLPPLKSGTHCRNTSSQPQRCSPSGVTWKPFGYKNLSVYNTLVDLVVISVT